MAAEHLVELDDRLRGVELPGALALVGGALGRPQQIGRARIDLGRREEASHEVAVGAVVPLVELDGTGEALPTLLLVPFPFHSPAVAREPATGTERESHVDAQAEVAGARHDVLAGATDLPHGRDAAAEERDHREVDARAGRFLVLRRAADRQELEEAGVVELRVAAVLDERAVERRAADVRVGRDESGCQHRVAGIDGLDVAAARRRLPWPDRDDAVAVDDHCAVAEQAVAAAVESDHVTGVDGDRTRHGWSSSGATRMLASDPTAVRRALTGPQRHGFLPAPCASRRWRASASSGNPWRPRPSERRRLRLLPRHRRARALALVPVVGSRADAPQVARPARIGCDPGAWPVLQGLHDGRV